MVVVKGSKQHQMIVVPHRPWYRASLFCLCILAVGALLWFTYDYGLRRGLDLRAQVVEERDQLIRELDENGHLVENMRQEIADLRVGGEIDSRATEEVRQTVESLQGQIAELNEEIRFYKGVMLPNVEETGLRIERLRMTATSASDRVRYNLLLTQVVDEHEFIQGNVKINIIGTESGIERTLSLDQTSDRTSDSIGFRFRYFQNIDGVLTVPEGFEPREVLITARSSGSNSQERERRFDWQPNGG